MDYGFHSSFGYSELRFGVKDIWKNKPRLIVQTGNTMIQLFIQSTKYLIQLFSCIGSGFISIYTGLRTEVPSKWSFLNIPRLCRQWFVTLHTICAFHIITSLSKCYLRLRNNLTLYIYYLMGFVFGMSTYAKLLIVWLKEVKKTCQALFLEVEAKLKKGCSYFTHQFVIFNGVDLTISN